MLTGEEVCAAHISKDGAIPAVRDEHDGACAVIVALNLCRSGGQELPWQSTCVDAGLQVQLILLAGLERAVQPSGYGLRSNSV